MADREKKISNLHSFKFWDNYVKNIPIPCDKKTIWAENYTKLSILLIEPRKHEWLEGTLYNLAHIYGGTDTQLYIFYGNENYEYLNNIIKDWKNVKLFSLKSLGYTTDLQPHPLQHSTLCCDVNLWKKINSDYVLTFTTTSFLRRKVDDIFFEYSFIGAPWKNVHEDKCVGNGGFSLRNIKDMIEVCKEINFDIEYNTRKLLEDTLINEKLRINKKKIPSKDIASQFSVETIFHENPVGCHAPARYFNTKLLKKLAIKF